MADPGASSGGRVGAGTGETATPPDPAAAVPPAAVPGEATLSPPASIAIPLYPAPNRGSPNLDTASCSLTTSYEPSDTRGASQPSSDCTPAAARTRSRTSPPTSW